ncbi:hypothetical protein CCAX7_10870 [Capsulimonas corticalis]|uniref:Uncharacterized protein n=1 Tax=Capsulimonas corticalis TaxID=2219043 RepID=A0A402CUN1_9BACT|nr:hypothetical protein [Capsulimonas corticalis]BDI29036.1 hypothetical protein CCAX7_10870 [Capsulimonas corticalis]
MIKLINSTSAYWEIWNDGSDITVHWGHVGHRGQSKTGQIPSSEIESVMKALAEEQRAEGFRDLTDEDYIDFVIQYCIDGWGTETDLHRRHRIEDLMNEVLGWTGNGHCDGGDIGSGSMTIYCFVLDIEAAHKTVWEELTAREWDAGATLAYSKEDEYVVLHPKGGAIIL